MPDGYGVARDAVRVAAGAVTMRAGSVMALAVTLVVGCGSGPLRPSSLTARAGRQTAHFTFHYPPIDAATIEDTGARIEREYPRVLADLGVAAMPRVHVTYYTDHAALEAATVAIAGVVPPWAYGLVTAEDQIHCMSPNLAAWGPYARRMSDLTHEFAHGVTLHLNPRFANRPRWLWESVAVFEAGQFVDPRTLPYLWNGTPPTLAALSVLSDTRIYDVGYSIGAFIVSRWGRDALRALILANGDTPLALGVTEAEFQSEWWASVGIPRV